MKVINTTKNGQIFICSCHNKINFEFGNVFVKMTEEEFRRFKQYVKTINSSEFLRRNRGAQNRRKLLLHVGGSEIFFALNADEFSELKELLSLTEKPRQAMQFEVLNKAIILN